MRLIVENVAQIKSKITIDIDVSAKIRENICEILIKTIAIKISIFYSPLY